MTRSPSAQYYTTPEALHEALSKAGTICVWISAIQCHVKVTKGDMLACIKAEFGRPLDKEVSVFWDGTLAAVD